MELELDSQNITPPSSPILGFSRGAEDDNDHSVFDSGVVLCLNCKGPPRPNDYLFKSDSYILRREVISALETLSAQRSPFNRNSRSCGGGGRLTQCFNCLFDLTQKDQLQTAIAICRKNLASLEILSESSHSYNYMPPPPVAGFAPLLADDPDELWNQNPWTIRSSVCYFLHSVVRHLTQFRVMWKGGELETLFSGLLKSIGSSKDWSSVLKDHCGSRNGNDCTAANYHFFHLQLELRWCLLLIFDVTPPIIEKVLDDLVHLSWNRFSSSSSGQSGLDEKQPFNCVCVKEIWTMLHLIIDDVQPLQKTFWQYYEDALKRVSNNFDPYFAIWLTTNLAHTSEYTVAGNFSPGGNREEGPHRGYKYLQMALKEWSAKGGKSQEILRLTTKCFQHWGPDGDSLLSLWTQWVPRLDKGANGIGNFDSYSTLEKWLNLVEDLGETNLSTCEAQSPGTKINLNWKAGSHRDTNDNFLEFVALVAGHAKGCSPKDIRRLNSGIFNKLPRNVSSYGENGLIRVCTLFLVLASLSKSPKDAMSIWEKCLDIMEFKNGKGKSGTRRKTIFRAYSVCIAILLKQNADMGASTVVTNYMKIVDELLCSACTDPTSQEVVMIYIELLDKTPHVSSDFSNKNLGRHVLLSTNLLMWLNKCGPNHVLRALRAVSRLSAWIVTADVNMYMGNCDEPRDLFRKICEKCLPVLRTSAIGVSNRVPATDMEPLANLAADITILSKQFNLNGKGTEECNSHFNVFAMDDRTCPVVSEFYIARLFQNREFATECFGELKLAQVWVRLLALNCSVPDQLTEFVLGTSFQSTSNDALLRQFCKHERFWDRSQIQKILSPLSPLLKGVVSGTLFKVEQTATNVECKMIVSSVISTCALLLKNIPFDKMYIKGDSTSCGHMFLEAMVYAPWPGTPPWEKMSTEVLKALEVRLFDIFQTIHNYPGLVKDYYLQRKLEYIVLFAFFGYLKEDCNKDEHPAFTILNFAEDNNITSVQSKILPNIVGGDHVVKDAKLSARFIQVVTMIKSKGCATLVIRVLYGILRIYFANTLDNRIMNSCTTAAIYCCQFGMTPMHKDMVLKGFEDALSKDFSFKSKRVFQLCSIIGKCTKSQGKKFLKLHLLPLLKRHVKICEGQRAIGIDKSLREPLQALETALADVQI